MPDQSINSKQGQIVRRILGIFLVYHNCPADDKKNLDI